MQTEKRPTLTLPKKAPAPENQAADERAEFLALQQTIHAIQPKDGSQKPQERKP